MSEIRANSIKLDLPEDVAERIASVQEKVSILDGQIRSKTEEVESKKVELDIVNSKLAEVNADLKNKIEFGEKIKKDLADRELRISQKESALDVYANALKEKEEKINKYLNIFENMKSVISK